MLSSQGVIKSGLNLIAGIWGGASKKVEGQGENDMAQNLRYFITNLMFVASFFCFLLIYGVCRQGRK